jgi:hypothetical protein
LAEHRTRKKASTALLDSGSASMVSPQVISEAMPPLAARRRPAQFALPSRLRTWRPIAGNRPVSMLKTLVTIEFETLS